jgi:CBS domain-containing protein
MTEMIVTVTPGTSLDACCSIMEDRQVRRVPVVDANGRCCGMVAQADIAQYATKNKTAEVVKEVSKQSAATPL